MLINNYKSALCRGNLESAVEEKSPLSVSSTVKRGGDPTLACLPQCNDTKIVKIYQIQKFTGRK